MRLFLVIVIIILLIVLILPIIKKHCYRVIQNLQFIFSLPGTPILLSIIHSLQIFFNYKELLKHVVTVTEKYESPSRLILGTNMFVLLTKPKDVKLVLTNANGNYKNTVTKMWQEILGNGIIRISGAAHKIRRKMIHPLFNYKYLSEYVTFFDNYSNCCADVLEKESNGHIFDIKPYVTRYVFDTFLATMAGIEGNAQRGNDYDDILYWHDRLFKLIYNRTIKPWLHSERNFSLCENAKQMHRGLKVVRDFIHDISRKIMQRDTLEHDIDVLQRSKSPLLEQLFNSVTKSIEVSNEDFIDDIKNLYVANQNIVTEFISFVLLMLATHTEIQEKVRDEISTTFENDKIDAARLSKMQYLRSVIQETLRLFPIVPIIARQLTADIELDYTKDSILESRTLPEGCFVMIPIFAIHRNPSYWYNANEFIPERFLPENLSKCHRYAYIPFGSGLRDCPGQRYASLCAAVVIANLVRRFRFTSNMKNIDLTNDILLRCRDGVKLSMFRV